jgi:hypothetical protein
MAYKINSKKVVVKIFGGLGNQMFQYAIGRSIAKYNGMDFLIESKSGFKNDFYERRFGLSHFNIIADEVDPKILPKKVVKRSRFNFIQRIIDFFDNRFPYVNYLLDSKYWEIVYEKNLYYNLSVFKFSKNKYLTGYWQSELYFKDIRDDLLNEFSLKHPLDSINYQFSEKIKNTNSVGVHYRRLHGVSNGLISKSNSTVLGIVSDDYYKKAIEYMRNHNKEMTLFIFSDDINWVRMNVEFNDKVVFVDINGDNNNYLDLYLMSLCKHQIIANSSFSWWAAWLNQNASKIVISPSKWYIDEAMNKNDTIPSNWIKL